MRGFFESDIPVLFPANYITGNKAIYTRYFKANNNKKQKWIFTTPEKPEDAYGIYLYAGTKNHTANIGVKMDGIKLQKGINEN